MPHELVPNSISTDLIESLEILLAAAKEGHITGLAYAATLPRRRYMVSTAGVCQRNLTHTRGMLMTLADEIGRDLIQREENETR